MDPYLVADNLPLSIIFSPSYNPNLQIARISFCYNLYLYKIKILSPNTHLHLESIHINVLTLYPGLCMPKTFNRIQYVDSEQLSNFSNPNIH